MKIFCTDETSVQADIGRPYGVAVYGGLITDEKTFKEFGGFLYSLKDRFKIPQKVELKWRFDTIWREMEAVGYFAPGVDHQKNSSLYKSYREDYDKLKEEVLTTISRSSSQIVIAIRPNTLLKASHSQQVAYPIESVAKKFEKLLEQSEEFGIILADALIARPGSDRINYEYILTLCCEGPMKKPFARVVSIVPTIDSHISPVHQLNDIVLGAIQFYLLEFARKLADPGKDMSRAKRILGGIVGRFCRSRSGDYVINNGILLYPPKINRWGAVGTFLDSLENQLKMDFNIK